MLFISENFRLRILLFAGFLALSAAAIAAPVGQPFQPHSMSATGSPSLTRLSAEAIGLDAVSAYRDPRAWEERLEPATIGTVGTGIGVGDFNADGWPDLFIAMREGKNRLYLNQEGKSFSDRTNDAGILESPDWSTGVTVADIDGNGLPDVYVCFFQSPNRLYLNYGDMKFEERAGSLGLAISDASSGAFFADYDRDGDLDLYLQTNTGNDGKGRPDYLFRNDGESGFTDVTKSVGILYGPEAATLGHSVLWLDYNGDGWEDLYIANDFRAPDFLYLNSGDGTFRYAPERVPVAPYSSMGADVGDVDGDGRLDILTTDMASPSYSKHVESMLTSAVKVRDLPADSMPPQVMKNALLLNRGHGEYVDTAYAWNLAATDWTWAPRLADLDNDGWQDALFTNGMIRQFHNADLALAQDRQVSVAAKTAVFMRSPVLEEDNLVFRNAEGKGFKAATSKWGFQHRGVSFAAALLDFDRDGDLDCVYTNYDAPPAFWRNDLGRGNAIQVKLLSEKKNSQAIGARVVAHAGGHKQAFKALSNRGYLGSDEQLIHIGMGGRDRIEKLEVFWPDGSRENFADLQIGYLYALEQGTGEGTVEKVESTSVRFEFLGASGSADNPTPLTIAESDQGLLYPIKPIVGPPKAKLIRQEFNGDDNPDTFLLRDWAAPRLLVSGSSGLADASQEWGVSTLSGVWSFAVANDFDGDGYADILLGGLGINNEFSYRDSGKGLLTRREGRFFGRGPKVNLVAYRWGDKIRPFDGLRDYTEIEPRILNRVPSFERSGDLDVEDFIQLAGFTSDSEYEITQFKSGILWNRNGSGFEFKPLPEAGQNGRVWAAAFGDIDGNGFQDLILLLGYVTPHTRSSQPEATFLSVLISDGDRGFREDTRALWENGPGERIVSVALESENGEQTLVLGGESGKSYIYRINP